MIELMCDCPELQDDHIFEIGDYVYDNGMMNIFGWGHGDPEQCGGYVWCQCADKLQRIPTEKELIHFAKLKRDRMVKKYAKMNERYPALEEDYIIRWLGGGRHFILDSHSINKFRRMSCWIKSGEGKVSIHKPGKKGFGWWHTPYPPMDYFYVWMPTQKQIQQLLMKCWLCNSHYIRTEFHRWYNEFQLTHRVWKLTGDEASIAFYMYKVHNKVWKFRTKRKQWKKEIV